MTLIILNGAILLVLLYKLYRDIDPILSMGNDGLVFIHYSPTCNRRTWRYLGDIKWSWMYKLIIKHRTKGKWKKPF